MLVSCICVCHDKPDTTHEAIQSIINQTYPHWEALVVDSGVLYDAGYYDRFAYRFDSRVKLIRSDETDEIRRTKAMAPWCYNECFRKGLVSGDLVMYLCDDDVLYPHAFATFVSYCNQNPLAKAMYASQDVAVIYPNGWRALVGERRANTPGGKFCNGRRMDCHVDYLQFCHKAEVLPLLAGDEYWPESKDSESHADGIFMERVGEHVTIFPIDVKISQNRRTPQSANIPVSSFALIECMANGIPFLPPRSNHVAKNRPPLPEAILPPLRTTQPERTMPLPADSPLVTISVFVWSQAANLAGTLAALAKQTYPNLEVLVINHCSRQRKSAETLAATPSGYPRFRFLHQNGGGALGDRGLGEAHGDYFIPMDAGTLACPDMVERFIAGMRRNPELSAMTCYVVSLRQTPDVASANSSTEEPRLFASSKNISSSGIFRVTDLRNVGGYGTEPRLPGQDWVAFYNLVNGGYHVEFLPEHLFYYLAPNGLSGPTVNEVVIRPFFEADRLLAAERVALWTAFNAAQQRLEQMRRHVDKLTELNRALQTRCASLRYQVADRLALLWARVPLAKRSLRWLLSGDRTSPKSAAVATDNGLPTKEVYRLGQ
jgi:glycosyltransferase involved in cell wall biosynthesis